MVNALPKPATVAKRPFTLHQCRRMASDSFRFDRFVLDRGDRQLLRDDLPVDLNARYFDALALLVGDPGKLVSKTRFMDEVWRGVPVTDEALTQCIKTLRRQLGDDAARPRFIETVPKHGYRFIAPVEPVAGQVKAAPRHTGGGFSARKWLLLGAGGTVGAGLAGLVGGLFYGFVGASQPLQPGMGAISVLLVLVCVTILVALLGGAGVAFGIAAAGFARRRTWYWTVLGGGLGGFLVGAIVKLLGLDAFNLLFGDAPAGITGAGEGLVLGFALGLAAWLAGRGAGADRVRRGMAIAAAVGGAAGALVPLLGGRLLGGSLDLLARHFPESRLRLDHLGAIFGEQGLGLASQMVTGALEGGLFASGLVGAMLVAGRDLES